MKTRIFFAAIAALFLSVAALAQNCVVPFEWCTLGCPDIGGYAIAGFGSQPAAQAFIASLNGTQQETVRVTTVPAIGTHVIVAYRLLVGTTGNASVQVGLACQPYTVTMRGFAAIETAEAELNQLPQDQRASASVLSVLAVPNDPNTRALLIVMRQSSGVQDGSVVALKGVAR